MRKTTFSSQRFQIDFGITEENEDEVRAAQEDGLQTETIQSETIVHDSPPSQQPEQSLASDEEKENISTQTPPIIKEEMALDNASSIVIPLRRQTLPEITISSPLLPVTTMSLHSSARRSSITNAAISSSIGPSIIGIFPGASNNLVDGNLRRSETFETLNFEESANKDPKYRRWSRLPFLKGSHHQHHPLDEVNGLNGDESKSQQYDHQHHYHHHHHHHHHLPHLHVPNFMLTGPSSDGTGRKFSFGIRRHSHTVCLSLFFFFFNQESF